MSPTQLLSMKQMGMKRLLGLDHLFNWWMKAQTAILADKVPDKHTYMYYHVSPSRHGTVVWRLIASVQSRTHYPRTQ